MSNKPTHSNILPRGIFAAAQRAAPTIKVAPVMREAAGLSGEALYARLQTRATGLTSAEVTARLAEHGPNVLARDARKSFWLLLWHAVLNPLVILLAVLASISFLTNDFRAGVVMTSMIVLSLVLKLVQESKADHAAAKLKAMISVTATVLREGQPLEIPLAQLVPGDIVKLAAGDMIPADLRFLSAKDLFVTQGSLTGESFPIEKFETEGDLTKPPIELGNVAFLGTNVESGTALAVVVTTGQTTYLGGMASAIAEQQPRTAFERGVSSFTWLILRFMVVMVPLVFVINGVTKGNWVSAFFFAVAVAVGLTPEMLPMIITVCLSKGALAMAKKQVIVKRLDAIQNLGAMDVLCTDKTGTLTMDHVVLERHCDVVLAEDARVLELAYLNSHFQTGLKNVLDRAILAHPELNAQLSVAEHTKVDEIPFDFQRRIMSVVVRTPAGKDLLIAKGAPEAIFKCCTQFELDGELLPMDPLLLADLTAEYERLSADGFRVLAVASKVVEPRAGPWAKGDECGLNLNGYVAFLDPPKDSAAKALAALKQLGIAVKVVTGDNELVSRKVCKEVGLPLERVLVGATVEDLTDEQLAEAVESTSLFARVSPAHKKRIIKALQSKGHTVGFMGDGINDAPALRTADVGISVDSAVDIAKESAELILLERSLMVLAEGVIEGRKVFVNILKYVRMGASSNFGNMFSVLGASVFVPFLPMMPIQILTNNLLYDLSQTAIPTDDVDPEQIARPRPWDMKALTRFILFLGPCSSVFDYATFLLMLYAFGCWDVSTPALAAHSAALFQSGWFVESLATQTLIIHIIRTNKIPFLQSRPSSTLILTSVAIILAGLAIPASPLGHYLGFTSLPWSYWPALAVILTCYVALTQGVKMWLVKRVWI